MDLEKFEAIVTALESENKETKEMISALETLIADTKEINSILEEDIKSEISKEKRPEFIESML